MNNLIKTGLGLLGLSCVLGAANRPRSGVMVVPKRSGRVDPGLSTKLLKSLEGWARTCQVCGGVFKDELTEICTWSAYPGYACSKCKKAYETPNTMSVGLVYKNEGETK